MAKPRTMDLEILTMQRCARLLASLPNPEARVRVAQWLLSAANRPDMPEPPPPVSDKQESLFE